MAVLTSASAGRDEQVRRLDALASEALRAFGVPDARPELLVHTVSSTFRVRSGRGDFALRLLRPAVCDRDEIRSEQIWLESLRRGAGRRDDRRQAEASARRLPACGAAAGAYRDVGGRPVHLLRLHHERFQNDGALGLRAVLADPDEVAALTAIPAHSAHVAAALIAARFG